MFMIYYNLNELTEETIVCKKHPISAKMENIRNGKKKVRKGKGLREWVYDDWSLIIIAEYLPKLRIIQIANVTPWWAGEEIKEIWRVLIRVGRGINEFWTATKKRRDTEDEDGDARIL